MFENDNIQLDGMAKLTRAIKDRRPPHIEIGIIEDSPRKDGESSNAEIGAAHEYGAPQRGLPVRSWLRMPLKDHLQEKMEEDQLLNEKSTKEVMKLGTIRPWMEAVKVSAIATVLKAFGNAGWGTWQPWKDPNYTNNTGEILQDTQQLKNSVDAKVVD